MTVMQKYLTVRLTTSLLDVLLCTAQAQSCIACGSHIWSVRDVHSITKKMGDASAPGEAPIHLQRLISSWLTRSHLNISLPKIIKREACVQRKQNCNFPLCKTSRNGTIHNIVHDVNSTQNKNC